MPISLIFALQGSQSLSYFTIATINFRIGPVFPILQTSGRGFVTFVYKLMTMIKTGNPVISIYTEMTPNPETMKFVANKLLYPGKSIDFPDVESAKPSPLA